VFFAIYIVANKLKVIYRSEPVLPNDLKFISDAKAMLPMISTKILVLAVVAILLIVTICVMLEKIFSKELLRFNIVTRIILVLLAGLSIGGFYNVNQEGS